MTYWIATCIVQTMYLMMPPVRYWYPYYRMFQCYRNKCKCRGMFTFHDVPPNIMQSIRDDQISYDFVNSAWNLLEGRTLSIKQREALDIHKYFNGYRGPR